MKKIDIRLTVLLAVSGMMFELAYNGITAGSLIQTMKAQTPGAPASSVPSPVVKMQGHTLGETVGQYRDVEHIGAKCEVLLGDQKLLAKIQKYNEAESKKKFQTKVTRPDLPYRYDLCQQLQIAETGPVVTYSTLLFEITFAANQLVRYRQVYNADAGQPFAQIEADLSSKYGAPDLAGTETYQNNFGAQFPVGRARWTLPGKTTISAIESVDYTPSVGYYRSTLVTIELASAPSVTTRPASPFE